MRRSVLIPWAALALALLACNTPGSGTPPTITPIVDPPLGVTSGAMPTAGDPNPTPIPPTDVPPTANAAPAFTGPLIFTTLPGASRGFLIVAAAPPEVYALWDYHNMRDGLTVRREWYRDGALIINREERWDVNTYGTNGVMRDVKIYDYDGGLESGVWELRLYIDNQLQVMGSGPQTFTIAPPGGSAAGNEYPSPDGSATAIHTSDGKLYLRKGGSETLLVTTDEITEVQWFPDSRLIAYIRPDRSDQQFFPATIGLKTELHFVDSQNGQDDRLIGDPSKVYQHPVISPNGVYIALQTGTEYGDAGFFDRGLEVITLTADYQLESTRSLIEFVPAMGDSNLFGNYYPTDLPGLFLPGVWDSNTVLRVAIDSTGLLEEATLRGVYLMDAASGVGTKTADLP